MGADKGTIIDAWFLHQTEVTAARVNAVRIKSGNNDSPRMGLFRSR